jgi:hypothetical protein
MKFTLLPLTEKEYAILWRSLKVKNAEIKKRYKKEHE